MFLSLVEYSRYFSDQNSNEAFVNASIEVSRIITAVTGIEAPAAPENAPDWVKLPAALITNWLFEIKKTGLSKDKLEIASENYKKALDILNLHRVKSNNKTFEIIEVKDLYNA